MWVGVGGCGVGVAGGEWGGQPFGCLPLHRDTQTRSPLLLSQLAHSSVPKDIPEHLQQSFSKHAIPGTRPR